MFEALGCFCHGCDCQMAQKEANAHIVKLWHERRRFEAERKKNHFEVFEIFCRGSGMPLVDAGER